MKPALMIFNPRRITEAISSLERLPIDKFWLTGYTEKQLVDVIPRVIDENPSYTHWVAHSDDGIVPRFALDAVLEALYDGHPVVTGYSNLDAVDMRVNLTRTPFRNHSEPLLDDYDLYHLSEVLAYPKPLVPSYFAAYALTGMPTGFWNLYPFEPIVSWASDWKLSVRLNRDEIPIVAPQAAFTWHLKEKVNTADKEPRKQLLVGKIPAEVRFVPWR